MLMGMGDFMEASRTFFQLIKRNPDYYKAYLGIAMSFDKMEKYKDAIRYLYEKTSYCLSAHPLGQRMVQRV